MASNICAPFWSYRLGSIGLIVAAVLLLMTAFGATVALDLGPPFVVAKLPFVERTWRPTLGIYRLVPAATLFFTFYILFLALTPVALPQDRMPQMAGRIAGHGRGGWRPSSCCPMRSSCSAATI